MNRCVEVSAKNAELAIAQALEKLGIARVQAQIEVLDEGRAGIPRPRAAGDAVVRVTGIRDARVARAVDFLTEVTEKLGAPAKVEAEMGERSHERRAFRRVDGHAHRRSRRHARRAPVSDQPRRQPRGRKITPASFSTPRAIATSASQALAQLAERTAARAISHRPRRAGADEPLRAPHSSYDPAGSSARSRRIPRAKSLHRCRHRRAQIDRMTASARTGRLPCRAVFLDFSVTQVHLSYVEKEERYPPFSTLYRRHCGGQRG